MYEIKRVSLQEVQACKFKPEPHTVALKDEGEWWALVFDGKIASVLCVTDKHGGKYFSENFTAPEYRGRRFFTTLLDFVANYIYKDHLLIAHCLQASKNCYGKVGFMQYNVREFKHGTQYFMRKEAGNGETEN